MNELFLQLGIEHLKPLATAMLLPPMPFVLFGLIGLALLRQPVRALGSALVLVSLASIWLAGCLGAANAIAPLLLRLPSALSEAQIAELKRHAAEPVAIVVLGAGVEAWAPEYGASNLQFRSLERLRYGIWLGRRTGWPTGFSGGIGWGQPGGAGAVGEATVAQRIATLEFGRPLRWVEAESKDTRENAINTMRLMRSQGVRHILLVTNAWHMARAMRNFERAAGSDPIWIEAAPMGLATHDEALWARWLPSGEGLTQTRAIVREWMGALSGA